MNEVRPAIREIKPHKISPRRGNEEGRTRNEGHALANCLVKQLFGADTLRQFDPEKESSIGPRPTTFDRKVLSQCREHRVASFTIDGLDPFDMRVEVKSSEQPGRGALLDR